MQFSGRELELGERVAMFGRQISIDKADGRPQVHVPRCQQAGNDAAGDLSWVVHRQDILRQKSRERLNLGRQMHDLSDRFGAHSVPPSVNRISPRCRSRRIARSVRKRCGRVVHDQRARP